MTKTYLKELRGQVRGNARLRRRLDSQNRKIATLKRHVGCLVTMLDKLGYGDESQVASAAASIGWERLRDDIRAEIEKVFGVKL